MPLGIFGGSSVKDGGPKPQPLTSEEKTPTKKEKAAGTSNHNHHTGEIKDAKGSTVKLSKKTYTFERKLAEGSIIHHLSNNFNSNLFKADSPLSTWSPTNTTGTTRSSDN
jgi:hypothetical protein